MIPEKRPSVPPRRVREPAFHCCAGNAPQWPVRNTLALELDLAGNRPLQSKGSRYLDSAEDAVTLDVRFSTLDNNATYASTIVLEAKGKNLTVNVQNSGYRRQ